MSALKNHVLHEIAQLDTQSLAALEPLLAALKKPTKHLLAKSERGVAASRCRQILTGLKGSLSQTIHEEREDRV